MKLTNLLGQQIEVKPKRNWKTKRFLEYVYEDCLNCGKELRFSIYEEAEDFETKTGRPCWDTGVFVHGEKTCSCGASFLIADDYENTNIYWLNQKEMQFPRIDEQKSGESGSGAGDGSDPKKCPSLPIGRRQPTSKTPRKEEVDFPSPAKQQEILEEAMDYAKNSRKEPQEQDIPWVSDKKQIKMLKDTTENVRP